MEYNRYEGFMKDDEIKLMPFIRIPEKISDKKERYVNGVTRFDLLSYKYYKNPNYGWLIHLANPKLGGLEFKINTNTIIRIPFPLEVSLNDYRNKVIEYIRYYGVK